MPLARLITHTPEFAQSLARSLETAGYSVEFLAPEEVSITPADLEVNLDDPSAASSYLVTPDGTEISFAYDPVEREFILAPAWRKLKDAFAPMIERLQRKREPLAVAPVEAQAVVSPEEHHAPQVETAPAPSLADLTPTTVMEAAAPPVELVRQSLYLSDPVILEAEPAPEPVQFTGAEYFDGQGLRKIPIREKETLVAPAMPIEEAQPDEAPRTAEPAKTPRTPWLVTAAIQAEGLRQMLSAEWTKRRTAIQQNRPRLSQYDLSWLRAVPVAAIITLAFLLGWGFSGAQRPVPKKAAPAISPATSQASVLPIAAPKPAAMTAVTPAKAAPKRAVVRDFDEDDEDVDAGQDVVVRHYPRHYPSKGVQAANQKPSVKRFSDID